MMSDQQLNVSPVKVSKIRRYGRRSDSFVDNGGYDGEHIVQAGFRCHWTNGVVLWVATLTKQLVALVFSDQLFVASSTGSTSNSNSSASIVHSQLVTQPVANASAGAAL